jgi:uncharacterized protein YkwD
MKVNRRDFLQSASAGIGISLLTRHLTSDDDLENTIKEIRANLLEMINEERAVAKVPPVQLDELATQVATKHGVDMAVGEYASHWGRDGLKPYQRYSFAGGTEANEENISAADNTWSLKIKDLRQDTAYLHLRLYQEKPPNDGHRKTILAPQHTHVGIGLAVQNLRLRLVELFVGKYVEVRPVRRQSKPGAQFYFSGKMLRKGYELHHVEVFYEPTPAPPEISWLRQPRTYSLPEESQILRPKVAPPFIYGDGNAGQVDIAINGSFRAPVRLYKAKPGIYTVVAYLKDERTEKVFAGTEVCVEAV